MVQYLQARDFWIYFNSYENSFVFIWRRQMGERKTWTVDYGLVHGLDCGLWTGPWIGPWTVSIQEDSTTHACLNYHLLECLMACAPWICSWDLTSVSKHSSRWSGQRLHAVFSLTAQQLRVVAIWSAGAVLYISLMLRLLHIFLDFHTKHYATTSSCTALQ